jgi:transposase InsO family protein
MPSSSISGYVYYVSFIDDYSHKTWLYLLKFKDEVFNKFKEFKDLIENLSERKIKILMSDNGGEYTSKEFVNSCKNVGIKRELSTPYNPQQNGVAERKNRTIMEAVKTMIHGTVAEEVEGTVEEEEAPPSAGTSFCVDGEFWGS